jgi:predicted DNA-binding transcriptional regulator AlpA
MNAAQQPIQCSPDVLRALVRDAVAEALASRSHSASNVIQQVEVPSDDDALLDLKAVKLLTSLGKTEIYSRIPGRCSLGPRCARWRAGDVRRWLRAQANKGGQK